MRHLLFALLLGAAACGGGAPPEPPAATFVKIAADGRSLHEQLVEHVAEAKKAGLVPFVQLYGDWCRSCRALRSFLDDPQMKDAFAGTYVVQIDTAVWHTVLINGFWVEEQYAVPKFYELRDDGTFGDSIDGNAWKGDVPSSMAPALRAFFRKHGAGGV